MRKLMVVLGILVSFALSAQQIPKGITAANGVYIGFLEYKPVDYNPGTQYPVIIFLHGVGERGNGTTDIWRAANVGIPARIQWQNHPMRFFWNGKWETFLVLSPQLSYSYGSWPTFYVEEMIKYAKANLSIDPNRIFLTGLSLGGGGTWAYSGASAANANNLAGIVPICGTCQNPNWCNIANANLPVWAFHASNDGVVSVNCTNNAINNINNCNPAVKPLKTIWPDGDHYIWDRAYDTEYNWQNPNIYEWFLGQNKSLAPNIYPVANGGGNSNIPLTGSFTLNGSSSYDPDGSIVRYVWTQVDGPSSTIVNPSGGTTLVTGIVQEGTYEYELKVIDNRASWTIDKVKVKVKNDNGPPPPNIAPIANAGQPISITLPNNFTTLDGTGSSDPDGYITSYSWTKLTGPSSFDIASPGANVTAITNLVLGVYVFQLQVTDNNNSSSTALVTVTVIPGLLPPPAPPANQPPVVNAGNDVTITLPISSTLLTGTASDPDGNIAAYNWSQVSGPSSSIITAPGVNSTAVTNLVQGTYSFKLIATDNNGDAAEDIVLVTVNAAAFFINQPPVVNAGSDVTITLPTNSIILNGTATDPDGTITAYNWSQINGPSTVSIVNPESSSINITNLVQGIYSFKLIATDNNNGIGDDIIQVTVNAPVPINQPPVTNAGSDVTITLPTSSVTLSGIATDTDGTIASYSWSQVSGPSVAVISNPNANVTSISNLLRGSYAFKLIATDNSGGIDDDTVNVTVNEPPQQVNQPPAVNAGNNVTVTLPVNFTTLQGTASDSDGSISSYLWSKLSGPSSVIIDTPVNNVTRVGNLQAGTYAFLLVVIDNNGASGQDTVSVMVNVPAPVINQPPVADAGHDLVVTLPINFTILTGIGTDPDGSIANYLWTKENGPSSYSIDNSIGNITTIRNLVEGTYNFRLTVTDNNGATASDLIQVIVQNATSSNKPPVAKAGLDRTLPLPINSTSLNGLASYDPDGNIQRYEWLKISGPPEYTLSNSNSGLTIVRNLAQGVYAFQLTVWGDDWTTASDTVIVKVGGPLPSDRLNNFIQEVDPIDKGEIVTINPNPARDIINVRINSELLGNSFINIYDVTGRAMKKVSFLKTHVLHQEVINVYSQVPGMYFIEIVIDNKKKFSTRFFKK